MAQQECIIVSSDDEDAVSEIGALSGVGSVSGGSNGGTFAIFGPVGSSGGASASGGSGGSGGGASASGGSGGSGSGASSSGGSGGSSGGASASGGSGGSSGGASASGGSGGSGGGASCSGGSGGSSGGASASGGSGGSGGGASSSGGSGGSGGGASASGGSGDTDGGSTNDGVPYYVPRTLASRTSMTLNAKKWIAQLAEKKRLEILMVSKKKQTQRGYQAEVARLVFKTEIRKASADDTRLKNAADFVKRQLKNLQDGKFDVIKAAGNRVSGAAGRKKRVPNIRVALLDWFVDVRCSLKARLPFAYIQIKCEQLYQSYKKQMLEQGMQPEEMKFTRHWVNGWCKEYKINLKKPSKRYKLKWDVRKRRILQFLQNIWMVRHFMKMKFHTEPVIWSADQMPLHRNESSGSATLNFAGMEAVVKENHSLSRERVTVFTQVSSNSQKPAPPVEFLFKGAGTRTTVSVPLGSNIKVQWAPKGSYRLANLKQWVDSLPQILFAQQNQIVTLDNYSVHLDPSIRKELRNKGYILVLIGGGITGDIQVNDTHLHKDLKAAYRLEEADLNMRKLNANPHQVPTASRNEMISMFHRAHQRTMQTIDGEKAFKQNFITNAFDGSEDKHVDPEPFRLVGEEMKEFRKTLINSASPETMNELCDKITRPEGVGLPRLEPEVAVAPPDEGLELLDGDLTSEDESDDDSGDDSDEFEGPNATNPTVKIPAASNAEVTDGGDARPAASVPAESNADVSDDGDNSESKASNVRNDMDSAILKEFENLSAEKFCEGSSEMKPFL